MKIGNTQIGLNHPPYIIAEIGVNHDGDVGRALQLTDAAAEAGADAIKLQFFETDRLMSKAAKLAAYQKTAGETDPIKMLRRLELTIDEMALVVERAHSKDIHAIVTVFSTELVPIAQTLPWDAYKTASPDIINKPLLEALMHTKKPMVVSTGASTWEEVNQASQWLDNIRKTKLAFLQCVSSYPAPDDAIEMMRSVFEASSCSIGYSDHTLSTDTGRKAVLAGAEILEKHFTYDQTAQGPDHKASLTPSLFAEYVGKLPGSVQKGSIDTSVDSRKRVLDCEQDVRTVARQSITSTCDIPAGTTLTKNHLTIKRPGTGIPPYKLNQILGSKTSQSIQADTPITESDILESSSQT